MPLDKRPFSFTNASMRKCFSWAFALLASLSILAQAQARSSRLPPCRLGTSDQAWLDRSVKGWIAARRLILEAPVPPTLDAVIFDQRCELTSKSAMVTGRSRWIARPLAGQTILVGSQRLPIGVLSATIGDDTGTRFVMSVPSVWAKGGVSPGPLGLNRLMSAVMIHEATHVFQMSTYGKQIELLQKANHITDEQFNDDAIQAQFGKRVAFAASIRREIDLFFEAARTPNDDEARRLARTARDLMRARAGHYFVRDQIYQVRAEDLWLTLEGTAQWAGYRWLQLPIAKGGGGVSEQEAMAGFGKRGDSWTQTLGLGIALTVDRFQPRQWKGHVFGDGTQTLLELLDRSIGPGANEQPRLH